MRLSKIFVLCLIGLFVFTLYGCQGTFVRKGKKTTYAFPELEAQWIRDGEPIEFEEDLWLPQDDIDVLLDEEMHLLGQYKDVEFFAYKVDVRPYRRIYTKFGKNKFRIYERKYNN